MFFWTAGFQPASLIMSRPEAGGPEDDEYERTWRSALRYITAGSTSSFTIVSATRRCSMPDFQ
jgi:hypothetical protein